jgi:hypothetical protein
MLNTFSFYGGTRDPQAGTLFTDMLSLVMIEQTFGELRSKAMSAAIASMCVFYTSIDRAANSVAETHLGTQRNIFQP